MGDLYANSLTAFLLVTVCLGGGAAFMTGRAVALSWQGVLVALGYVLLLAAATRFLHYALAHGDLLSLAAYGIDTAVLAASATLAHRTTRVRQMVEQYPWLYERAGPFAWRARG